MKYSIPKRLFCSCFDSLYNRLFVLHPSQEITDLIEMEEHNLIFGILSLLFVMSLVLFANLCVKLDKKKQPNSDRYAQVGKSANTESMQK